MMNQVIELPTPSRRRADAQALMQQAWNEQDAAERARLALEVFDNDSSNIDAVTILVSHGQLPQHLDPIQTLEAAVTEEAVALEAQGLDREYAGNYWANGRTRVYVRALAVLVRSYLKTQNWSQAKETCQVLMALDTRDTQGQRYILAKLLIRDGDYAAYHKLDAQFKHENSVMFLFNRALVAYVEQGRCDESTKLAKRALVFNPDVPKYFALGSDTPMPVQAGLSPAIAAWLYVKENRTLWARTPGAIRWLASVAEDMRS